MGILWRLFPGVLLGVALLGCATQKPQSAEADGLHRQAVAALDERRFTIEAIEFYPASGAAPVSALDSYISMNGKYAVMRISPDVLPHLMRENRQVEDHSVKMTELKSRKTGERQYRMKIEDADISWMNEEMVITLYKGTNLCLV